MKLYAEFLTLHDKLRANIADAIWHPIWNFDMGVYVLDPPIKDNDRVLDRVEACEDGLHFPYLVRQTDGTIDALTAKTKDVSIYTLLEVLRQTEENVT